MEMGVPNAKIYRLARDAHNSLETLRRGLAAVPTLASPAWSMPDHGPGLIPALLAGAWERDRESDRTAISRLAGRDYDEVEDELMRWANGPDPPVRQIGSTWTLVSKNEAWHLLSRYVHERAVERFLEVAAHVLGEDRLEASASNRYSKPLRLGVADTLALIASSAEDERTHDLSGDLLRSAAKGVDGLVCHLLRIANTDVTGERWRSLSDVLPLLAEAAPYRFLNAVGAGLDGDTPVIATLFADPKASGLQPTEAFRGLQWALETVAWPPDHMAQAALLLARFARLDLGGRLAHRPRDSLHNVFFPWSPQTAATADERTKVLDMLLEREPDAGVDLLADLVWHDREMFFYNTMRWRHWQVEWSDPPDGCEEFGKHVVRSLIKLVDSYPRASCHLVKSIASNAPSLQHEILGALDKLELHTLDSDELAELSDCVQVQVARQRSAVGTDVRMDEDDVDRLESFCERIASEDAAAASVYYFRDANRPQILRDTKDPADESRLQAARRQAVDKTLEAEGFEAIARLARQVDDPFAVGFALGPTAISDRDADILYTWMDQDDQALRQVAEGYVRARVASDGWPWANATLHQRENDWTPAQRAAFLLALPKAGATWDHAERLGEDTAAAYWAAFLPGSLENPMEHERAARVLVTHARPEAAVHLLSTTIGTASMSPTFAVQVLEAAVDGPAWGTKTPRLAAAQLLAAIHETEEIDDEILEDLELQYLDSFNDPWPPKALHRRLERDPRFFAEVVSWISPATDEARQPIDPHWLDTPEARLLKSWKRLPGLAEAGSIDPPILSGWVASAWTAAQERECVQLAGKYIGYALRNTPDGADGAWPHEAVRDLIEELRSEHVEDGIRSGIVNPQGFVGRDRYDGGEPERALAEQYGRWASELQGRWPRTAAMLRWICDVMRGSALWLDISAEQAESM